MKTAQGIRRVSGKCKSACHARKKSAWRMNRCIRVKGTEACNLMMMMMTATVKIWKKTQAATAAHRSLAREIQIEGEITDRIVRVHTNAIRADAPKKDFSYDKSC